jgi:hypothetical protein
LAKIFLIWSTKIIAGGMHSIANWTRKALRPFSRQELKEKSSKPISSGGEMRSSNKRTELITSGGVLKHPIKVTSLFRPGLKVGQNTKPNSFANEGRLK